MFDFLKRPKPAIAPERKASAMPSMILRVGVTMPNNQPNIFDCLIDGATMAVDFWTVARIALWEQYTIEACTVLSVHILENDK